MVQAAFTVALMAVAAWGAGLAVLAPVRDDGTDRLIRHASALVLGIGVMGWLGFWLALFGGLSPAMLGGTLAVMAGGLAFLRRDAVAPVALAGVPVWLVVVLVVVLAMNLAVGLAPPIDADSLAYHFALPKQFLREGHLVFVPRAVDGAVPLLQQMTFMVALGLGAERAMTVWAALSNWPAALLLFAIARPHLGSAWSAAVAALFLTTPAVVYGMGGGLVEVRNAGFVLAAAYWAARAVESRKLGAAVVAGLAAGFFVASKQPGLVFLGVLGLAVLWRGRSIGLAAAVGVAAIVAGGQWYGWSWWNTGDPVFPMLYGIVPYAPGVPWNAEQAKILHAFIAGELALPRTVWNLVLYPFLVTLAPVPLFESLRTGFGPFVLAVLPLAAVAAWGHRRRLPASRIFFYTVLCLGTYGVWFLFGPSQRVRHLVPVYPLLLVGTTVAMARCLEGKAALRTVAIAVTAFVLCVQVGGSALYSLKAVRYVASSETRDAYLERYVAGYEAVQWINRHLAPTDLVLVGNRDSFYYYDVPAFLAHPTYQMEVPVTANGTTRPDLWARAMAVGITHVVVSANNELDVQFKPFLTAGCLKEVHRFVVHRMDSRTLVTLHQATTQWVAYAVVRRQCP